MWINAFYAPRVLDNVDDYEAYNLARLLLRLLSRRTYRAAPG